MNYISYKQKNMIMKMIIHQLFIQKLNSYKFLLMDDAEIEVEQDLIEKYNLQTLS